MTTGDVLTIETGIRCNNRCHHCPQGVIRDRGRVLAEPSTRDIEIRLLQGRDAGYESVAFSGGEPTIRRDLPELASAARRIGYDQVSITTNGRMLSYPGFVRKLTDSGVDGFTVSLHGPNAEIHDSLTGTPGSFQQAVQGLEALERAVRQIGPGIRRSTITVLVPETLPHLRDTLALAGSLGVALHIVQPFILSRETVSCADRFLLSLDDIEKGVRTACSGGLPHQARLKFYNLPLCRFRDLDVPVEQQQSRLNTFREHHLDLGGPGFQPSGQHVRNDSCLECLEPCPGFRLEHMPEAAMVAGFLQDIESFAADRPDKDLLLTGTDLLTRQGLELVLQGIGRLAPSRLRLVWGAMARTGIRPFMEACRHSRVDEIAFLLRPPTVRQPDGNIVLPGNLEAVARDLTEFQGTPGPRPSLFLVVNMLFSGFHELGLEQVDDMIRIMVAGGGRRLWLAAPEILDGDSPLRGSDLADRITVDLPDLLARWSAIGCEPRLVMMPRPTGTSPGDSLEDAVARLVPAQDWLTGMIPHRFAGPHMGWVMSSNLEWAYPP